MSARFLLLLIWAASLGLTRAADAGSAGAPAAAAPAAAVVTNIVPPAAAATGAANDNQILNPMDKLAFRIQEDPAKGAPETMAVTALFELHFPISRAAADMVTINVKGKTLAQVKQELKIALDADYYLNATIDLKLLDRSQKGGQILFYGQVRAYAIPLAPGEQKTLLEGVLQAGPTEWANLKRVEVQRIDPNTQKPDLKIIDVEAIKNGDRRNDILLQDGDRIKIPEVKFKVF